MSIERIGDVATDEARKEGRRVRLNRHGREYGPNSSRG
jgi:hypothetical protein